MVVVVVVLCVEGGSRVRVRPIARLRVYFSNGSVYRGWVMFVVKRTSVSVGWMVQFGGLKMGSLFRRFSFLLRAALFELRKGHG